MTTLDVGRGCVDGAAASDARTRTFDALGHRFAVASEDARIIRMVEEAFGVLAVCHGPHGWYHVRRHGESVELRWMEEIVGRVNDGADALDLLRADVQHRAIARAGGTELLLRAGCVEVDGQALLVSGARCGVSTLLAALVIEGCTYLSDDASPVEIPSGKVRPFPQPLLLDDRSLDLLPEVTALRSGVDTTSGRRLVPMHSARTPKEHVARDVSIVLFPELDHSGLTMLRPVDRDDAVVRLAENAYNFPGQEQATIEAIHSLVRDAEAFAVVGDDPHISARAVMDALAVAD
jgi:hypothetical protein